MPIPIKKFDCLYSNFGLLPLGVNILFSPSSKQDTVEIWDILRDHDCYLTEKEIESKITKLQDEGVIKQYTITVDTKKLRHRIIRIALVRLRVSQHLGGRFEGLKIFVRCSLCNVFRSGRTRGGYDWITCQAFLSEEMADEESDIFRNLFGDILQTYEVYDFIPAREASFQTLTHTSKEYRKFLDEYVIPFLGRR